MQRYIIQQIMCIAGTLLLFAVSGTGNSAVAVGVRTAESAVEVDTSKTIGYLSPLTYGVTMPVRGQESLFAEAANHGIRLIHIDAQRIRFPSEDLLPLIQMLRWARAHGLVPVVSQQGGDDVAGDASLCTALLTQVNAVGLSLPWVRLTPRLSQAVVANLTGTGVMPDGFSKWRSFPSTTFLISLPISGGFDEEIPEPKRLKFAVALLGKNREAVSPIRLGLAVETDVTSPNTHPLQATAMRQASLIPVFRLLNWATDTRRRPGVPDLPQLMTQLTALSEDRGALCAVILPDAASGTLSNLAGTQPADSPNVGHHFWTSFMGAIKLLSDWGNLHGLEVHSSSVSPLHSCATKSFGQFSTCLVNEQSEEHVALVKVHLPVGVYSVRSRLLVEDEHYLRSERSLGTVRIVPRKPTAEIRVSVPRRSILVLRGRNDALLAYRSCLGLYQCVEVCRQPSFVRETHSRVAGILQQVVRSARASMNHLPQNPLAAACSAHNALLRMAQVEAMLNNSAMKGNLPRVDFADMITRLRQAVEHLSQVSAQALGMDFEVVCSERLVRPGESFMCELRVANQGKLTLRNLRVFCENHDTLIVTSLHKGGVRSLAPGQTATARYSCKIRPEPHSQGFQHLEFGVCYSFRHSFAEMRREVDIAIL